MIVATLEFCQDRGIPVWLICMTHLLPRDCGIPEHVLDKYQGQALPLSLSFDDKQISDGTAMELFPDRIELTLSFDDLYRCTIPLQSVLRAFIQNPEYDPNWEPDAVIPIAQDGPNLRLVD